VTRQVRQFVAFIASPGDLPEEREALHHAAQAVNDTVGRRFGLAVVVEGWEQVQPAAGRPQGVINPRVDNCDIFIGLLSRRWGTATGAFSSGFEEEYERAAGRTGNGRPDIALFFRQLPAEVRADPGPQLQKVLTFQARVRDERVALYRTFTSVQDLELKLVLFLSDYLTKQAAASQQPPAAADAPGTATVPATAADVAEATETDAPGDVDEARRQIGEALQSWADIVLGRRPAAPPSRDRLLSFAVAMGQDGDALGTHLANRLYRERESLALSAAEADSWLRAFCEEAGRVPDSVWGRYVPAWVFFADEVDLPARLIGLAQGDVWPRARGAVVLLAAVGARPVSLWPNEQEQSQEGAVAIAAAASQTQIWARLLGADSTGSVALQYLHRVATPADRPLLNRIAAVSEGQPWASATQAVIASVLGDNLPSFEYLLAHPYSPPAWALDDVLELIPEADSEHLITLMDSRHTNDALRIRVFDELLTRNALDDATGPIVIAVMLRSSEGTRAHLLDRRYESIDESLRRWLRAGWVSLGKDDRRYGVQERVDALTRPADELAAAASPSLSGLDAWQALGIHGSPHLAQRARDVLSSGGTEFSDGLPEDDPRMVDVRPFLAAQARAAALQILASVPPEDRQDGDLDLVRAELASGEFVTAQPALAALAALAEKRDLPELFAALPQAVRRHETEAILATILERGGVLVARQLTQQEDDSLAAAGARALADDTSVGADELVELLYHANPAVRRAAFAGVVARLDDEGLLALLDSYAERLGVNHYYDVIAALDWHLYAPSSDDQPVYTNRF